MKKKFLKSTLVLLVSSSIFFTSCLGSFSLTNKVLDWNRSVGDKFINEIVFLAMCIVPVYEVSAFVDVIVLNSIEFWTGEEPLAKVGETKKVATDSGDVKIVSTKEGYELTNEKTGDKAELVFVKENRSWNLEMNGESFLLLQLTEDNKALVTIDGSCVETELNEAGVVAVQQAVNNRFLARK